MAGDREQVLDSEVQSTCCKIPREIPLEVKVMKLNAGSKPARIVLFLFGHSEEFDAWALMPTEGIKSTWLGVRESRSGAQIAFLRTFHAFGSFLGIMVSKNSHLTRLLV